MESPFLEIGEHNEDCGGAQTDSRQDLQLFDTLSSKIEDELRILDWEMSSSIQDDAISDMLGVKRFNSMCSFSQAVVADDIKDHEHKTTDKQSMKQDGDIIRERPENNNNIHPKHKSQKNECNLNGGKNQLNRKRRFRRNLAASRETLDSKSTRSSISSMSSNWEDDLAEFGDDEENASDSMSSCSSNEYGVDTEENRLAELMATGTRPITVLADRYLEDLRRVRLARNMSKIDRLARVMVNYALREVSTVFVDIDDRAYWDQLFQDDSTLIGNIAFDSMPFSFTPYVNLEHPIPKDIEMCSDKAEHEVIFKKTFNTDNVIFSDVPVFRINSEIALRASDKPKSHFKVVVEKEADSPEVVKSRRIIQRARFQMHDLQQEMRKLKITMAENSNLMEYVLSNGHDEGKLNIVQIEN